MAGMNLPVSDWMSTKLNDFDHRIQNLERQQLWVVTDHVGHTIARLGLQTDGTTGLTFNDASGNRRVDLGQLANGDYGLQVTDPIANSHEINPTSSSTNFAFSQSTTSTSFTGLSGSPEVTVWIGASGDALVSIAGTVTTPTGTNSVVGGRIGIVAFWTGSPIYSTGNMAQAGFNGGTAGAQLPSVDWPVSATMLASATLGTTLTPSATAGAYTFGIAYASFNGSVAAQFSSFTIVVTPI